MGAKSSSPECEFMSIVFVKLSSSYCMKGFYPGLDSTFQVRRGQKSAVSRGRGNEWLSIPRTRLAKVQIKRMENTQRVDQPNVAIGDMIVEKSRSDW